MVECCIFIWRTRAGGIWGGRGGGGGGGGATYSVNTERAMIKGREWRARSSSDSAAGTPATALMRRIHPLRRPVVRRPHPRIQSETHLRHNYIHQHGNLVQNLTEPGGGLWGYALFFPRLSPARRRVVLPFTRGAQYRNCMSVKLETGNVRIAHWRGISTHWLPGEEDMEEGGRKKREEARRVLTHESHWGPSPCLLRALERGSIFTVSTVCNRTRGGSSSSRVAHRINTFHTPCLPSRS